MGRDAGTGVALLLEVHALAWSGAVLSCWDMMATWVGDAEVLGTDGVVWEMRRTRRGWGGVGFGEKGRRKRVQRVWRGTGLVWCVVWAWRVVGVGVGEIGTLGFVFGDLMAS